MKYNRLTQFLQDRPSHDPWHATFEKVEKIVGFTLPKSAHEHQAWWSNFKRSQSRGWLDAGYKTANVDMKGQKVTFVYHGNENEHFSGGSQGNRETHQAIGELTIAEAKAGLAARFGVKESQIEIVIKA